MVAMMPLLSIQMVGFLYERKKKPVVEEPVLYGDDVILGEDPACGQPDARL